MAYLQDDGKLDGNQQDEQSGAVTGGGSALVGGQSSVAGSAPASTAGVGRGGSGGWTNIQSYLDANRGNNTTAQTIQNQYGKEFETEKSKLQYGANTTAQAAQDAGSKLAGAKSEATNYLRNVNRLEDRDKAATTLRGYLNQGYQGPQGYNYNISQPVQTAGERLGKGLDPVLQDVYDRAAGGRMSSGQRALQRQLDVNDESIEQTRGSLAAQYKALQDMANQEQTRVAPLVDQSRNQFATDQQSLRDYLDMMAQTYGPESKDYDQDRYNFIQDVYGLGGGSSEENRQPIGDTPDPWAGWKPAPSEAQIRADEEAERLRQEEAARLQEEEERRRLEEFYATL